MTQLSGVKKTRTKNRARTAAPLREELPALLAERGLSQRALARAAGVNQSHLSRIANASPPPPVSGDLAGRIAVALGLPRDYFPEYRVHVVTDAIESDAAFREHVYRLLQRRQSG